MYSIAEGDMGTLNDELRMLLSSDIPSQISKMEDCTGQLDQTATYCEMMYKQSHNKAEAFNATKQLTLQSLASVAYYVTSLSEALLRSLDLETDHLTGKTAEARNASQIVAIQREKSARREIGKLTISRNVTRKNKITYPAFEEKTIRYQRTPIDYSLLDGIGHGRQSTTKSSDYASTLNRSGSMASNDYGNYGGDVYADYVSRSGTQTLTRQSIRSMADQHQYRMPQLIPSALDVYHQHQQSQQIYQQLPLRQQQPQQIYMHTNGSDSASNNGHAANGHGRLPNNYRQLSHEMSGLNFADASTPDDLAYDAGLAPLCGTGNQTASVSTGYTLNRIRQPPPPQTLVSNNNHNGNSGHQAHYGVGTSMGYGNGDCLPPPPLSSNTMLPHADDPLPPPPPNIDNGDGTQLGINVGLIPTEYVEKARVIYAYEAKQPDELTLVEGAIVYVLIKNEDGWYEGVTDGVTGLFPGNYVAPAEM